MVIFGIYIVSKSGGLIFNYDNNVPKIEKEKKFSYPLDIKLRVENKKIVVEFGERDGIHGKPKLHISSNVALGTFLEQGLVLASDQRLVFYRVGHVLYSINGIAVTGQQMDDGQDALEFLEKKENYPVLIKFGRPKMTTNEKIFLASMFYPLFAIASQLSPEPKSSGIEVLEADTFRLNCFQTLTGVKIMVVSDPSQSGVELLLKRLYEIYADYALKNPFYSLEMPIRCELFDNNLKSLLEQIEKVGIANI